MTRYWSIAPRESLDARVERAGEIVSNINALRTGQLMEMLTRLDRKAGFLEPGKDVVLVDRDPGYLEEIMARVLPVFCPRYVVTQQNHHLPHYVVRDGRMTVYHNLDQDSQVAMVIARGKQPDSIAEKVSRQTVKFGRVCERHDRYKLMVGDINGFEVIVRKPEDVLDVMGQLLRLPFLRLEHYETHKEGNGYYAEHANLVYQNGNPFMRGLEVEAQVTDLQSHIDSKTKPEQAHDTGYGAKKLASRHDLGDRQLVIVGNHITIPEGLQVMEAEDARIVRVPNKIQPYTLVMPRQG